MTKQTKELKNYFRIGPRPVKPPMLFDRWLLFAIMGLFSFGILMVTSASIVISERFYNTPFHYMIRQVSFLSLGAIAGLLLLRVSLLQWKKISGYLMLISLCLLGIVLIPGIGREVNGATRWVVFGPIGFQVSELAKLSIVLYLAGYIVRHQQMLQTHFIGFIKPMVLLVLLSGLLLLEPDFGAVVVLAATAMTLLFLAGVPLRYFLLLALLVGLALGGLAFASPYRLARLTAFLDPWSRQFDSGYQLTQSLIAFGRGGWWGVGLGDSVQKLFYLPEAHTDFLFAVLAEELGLWGILVVLALFTLLITRILLIARRAVVIGKLYSAYVAYGFGLLLAYQVIINIGVNAGMLPTKGLTLPFMSYGGSSLLIVCIIVAILMRIDYEVRFKELGL